MTNKTLDTVKNMGKESWKVLPGGSLANYFKKVGEMETEEYLKKWYVFPEMSIDLKAGFHRSYAVAGYVGLILLGANMLDK
jgi:hypothetical protein